MNKDENQFGLLGQTAGFGFGNFSPDDIQEDEAILVVISRDISPSVKPFEKELNDAFEAFMIEMQGSHVASKLMVKIIDFNETVTEKTGFMPIKNMDLNNFHLKASGNSTALVDAAYKGVTSVIDYREKLEATGINCKVLVFVITDGQENSSGHRFSEVKAILEDLMKTEANVFSFETILFGIGDPKDFTDAKEELGFKHLAVVGNTGKEIRKMIGFISASISASSSGQTVTF